MSKGEPWDCSTPDLPLLGIVYTADVLNEHRSHQAITNTADLVSEKYCSLLGTGKALSWEFQGMCQTLTWVNR